MKYILSIDQSTSSTKAIIFDEQLNLVGRSNVEHNQIYPQAGWVEHDPNEIFNNLLKACSDVFNTTGVQKENVVCLSISNQRETAMLWDKKTGEPIYNAIVWQCCRGESISSKPHIIKEAETIRQKTGLVLSPYFSAAKVAWILENIDCKNKNIAFSTMDSWLVYKLTGNHYCDYTNACRTQLFNINSLEWDKDIIKLFGLENISFPQIKCSDEIFGETNLGGLLNKPIPIAGILGDSHGAIFGQQCWNPGEGKCTMGTGSSLMINIGDKPQFSNSGLATSIGWKLKNDIKYVFEGNVNSSGDTINWLIDNMQILPNSKESESYAQKVESTEGVYLVPAFTGLGAPHYKSNARAVIWGMNRSTNKYHIVRAALESIVYQIKDVMVPMVKEANIEFKELRVDGGPTNNKLLMQIMSDILDVNIIKNSIEELSALGAASVGAIATGIIKDKDALSKLRRTGETYNNCMSPEKREEMYNGWKTVVNKL
ncbi:MAG: glycerol kinase GlpK [Christensenellaceae bacterium]|nr:glycerol kinase GlpK [Christensenellaceae bacterium]